MAHVLIEDKASGVAWLALVPIARVEGQQGMP